MVERGMGRGLAAILPSATEAEESLRQLPLELISANPRQPRRSFPESELAELAASIKAKRTGSDLGGVNPFDLSQKLLDALKGGKPKAAPAEKNSKSSRDAASRRR